MTLAIINYNIIHFKSTGCFSSIQLVSFKVMPILSVVVMISHSSSLLYLDCTMLFFFYLSTGPSMMTPEV